jgi:hypothetical protein
MTVMELWSKKLGHGKRDGTDRWPDGLFLEPLHPEATEAIRYEIMDTKRRASDDNVTSLSSEAFCDGNVSMDSISKHRFLHLGLASLFECSCIFLRLFKHSGGSSVFSISLNPKRSLSA